MGHGQPDFGMYSIAQTIYRMTDMGELAARLGSPVTYHRSGDVIWMTDFEDGIAELKVTKSGLLADAVWSSDHKLRGGFSLKLVAGSDDERYVQIIKELAFPALSKLGLEAAFTEDANMEEVALYLTLYTGVVSIDWAFRYVHTTGQTYILTTDDEWSPVGDPVVVYTSDYLFSISKLVIDPVNLTYDKLIAGPQTFDLSAIAADVMPNFTLPRWEMRAILYSQAGVNATVYCDNIIITQNEP